MSKADYPFEYKKFEGDVDSEFDLTWTPKTTFQFAKKSLREAYEKNPNIDWYLTERSSHLWSKGRRSDQHPDKSFMDWSGQGYPFMIKFVESRGKIVGISNLFPSRNPDDGLDGKDAEGKPFSYNGKTFDFKTDALMGTGGTGVIHWKINEKLKNEIDPELYSGKGDELAGGAFRGGKTLIQQYRTVSYNYNKSNIHYNPVLLLLNCETRSDLGFFKRTMPLALSQPYLEFLLENLPVVEGQKREVTDDRRKVAGSPTEETITAAQKFEKFTDRELKQAVEERLIYFASQLHIEENTLNAPLLVEACREQKIDIDINFKDSHGRTALSYAFEQNNFSVVESFIELGADLFIADKNGKTPVDYNPGVIKHFQSGEYKWDNPGNKDIFIKKYQEYQQKQEERLCKASQNSYAFMPTRSFASAPALTSAPISTPVSTPG
jgi:Ankyrin repeats (many copies)